MVESLSSLVRDEVDDDSGSFHLPVTELEKAIMAENREMDKTQYCQQKILKLKSLYKTQLNGQARLHSHSYCKGQLSRLAF